MFHQTWMKNLRRACKLKYAAHVQYKDNYGIEVRYQDGRDDFFPLGGTPEDIKTENYYQLITAIQQRNGQAPAKV